MARVLLVDDEITMLQMVSELLRSEGHEVHPFNNSTQALEALENIAPELVITDLYLDKARAGGIDILKKARSMNPPAVTIVITGFGSIETAVEAMKHGAFDYLEKPFKIDETTPEAGFAAPVAPAIVPKMFFSMSACFVRSPVICFAPAKSAPAK